MKRVVVFGVFDILHPGHLYFLQEAKKYGDYLTVVVTRDARVRAEKVHRPVFSERERLKMVSALRWVDEALLGDRIGEWKILKRLEVNVLCLGYDQNQSWIKKCGLKKIPKIVKIRRWKTYRTQQYARH